MATKHTFYVLYFRIPVNPFSIDENEEVNKAFLTGSCVNKYTISLLSISKLHEMQ